MALRGSIFVCSLFYVSTVLTMEREESRADLDMQCAHIMAHVQGIESDFDVKELTLLTLDAYKRLKTLCQSDVWCTYRLACLCWQAAEVEKGQKTTAHDRACALWRLAAKKGDVKSLWKLIAHNDYQKHTEESIDKDFEQALEGLTKVPRDPELVSVVKAGLKVFERHALSSESRRLTLLPLYNEGIPGIIEKNITKAIVYGYSQKGAHEKNAIDLYKEKLRNCLVNPDEEAARKSREAIMKVLINGAYKLNDKDVCMLLAEVYASGLYGVPADEDKLTELFKHMHSLGLILKPNQTANTPANPERLLTLLEQNNHRQAYYYALASLLAPPHEPSDEQIQRYLKKIDELETDNKLIQKTGSDRLLYALGTFHYGMCYAEMHKNIDVAAFFAYYVLKHAQEVGFAASSHLEMFVKEACDVCGTLLIEYLSRKSPFALAMTPTIERLYTVLQTIINDHACLTAGFAKQERRYPFILYGLLSMLLSKEYVSPQYVEGLKILNSLLPDGPVEDLLDLCFKKVEFFRVNIARVSTEETRLKLDFVQMLLAYYNNNYRLALHILRRVIQSPRSL